MKTKLKHISIFSAVFLLLINSPILLMDFINYKSMPFNAIMETAKNICYIYAGLFLLFFGLSSHKILFIVGTFFLFIVGAISTYYIWALGIVITPEIVKITFHNEVADLYEIVSIKILIWGAIVFFAWVYLIKKYLKDDKILLPIWNIPFSLILLIFSLMSLVEPEYKLYKRFMPWQTVNSFALYLKNSPKTTKIDISKENNFIEENKREKIVVLVIGESARYDHFGINGYERDTTPLLSSTEDIFSFYANSCASMTYLSVSCLVSRHGKDNFDINQNETSILSIYNKLGFNTAWFGAQNIAKYFDGKIGGSFYDEAKTLIIPGGSALYKMNDYDEVMLPYIKDYVESSGNKFIVIHTIGSHWDYAKRYPENFNKFEPVCKPPLWEKRDPRDCSQEGLIGIYDNSILYTDYFLSKVIDILKDKDSFMIYTSDHAVSLGEGGRYGQGGTAFEQFEIPFIFWGSPKFWQANPDFKENILAKKGEKLSHDYVYHSLLGCTNIVSDAINPALNLCRKL